MTRKGTRAALALGIAGTLMLGTGMSKVHTPDEFITVKSLTDTARLVLALMTD